MSRNDPFLAFFATMLFAFAMLASYGAAQDGQILSPRAKAVCKFSDGKTITVNYSSPRMRGRKIYGGLVPYGEVWRAGADEATAFVPNVNVIVGGKEIPAGRYTLFTIPGPSKWTLIVSKQTGEWGIPYPGASSDLLRTDMRSEKLPSAVENFTIAFEQTGAACSMRLDWEKTRATLEISEKK